MLLFPLSDCFISNKFQESRKRNVINKVSSIFFLLKSRGCTLKIERFKWFSMLHSSITSHYEDFDLTQRRRFFFISDELLFNTLWNCLVLFQRHVFHPITKFSKIRSPKEKLRKGVENGSSQIITFYCFSPFGIKVSGILFTSFCMFLLKKFSNQNDFMFIWTAMIKWTLYQT